MQTLYNELRLRHQFEKLKSFDNSKVLEVAEEAWLSLVNFPVESRVEREVAVAADTFSEEKLPA